jgi:hypothetical protein
MLIGFITLAKGVIVWATTNYRWIGYMLVCAGLCFSGWWLASAYQDMKDAKKDKQFQEWYTNSNELAANYEKLRLENEGLKRKIRERIAYAKDSSFGCVVNADGVQLINDTLAAVHTRKLDQ